jgi:hypothetical protein
MAAVRETPGVSIELIPIGSVKREILKVLQAGISKAFHCPLFLGTEMPESDSAISEVHLDLT